MSIFGTVAFASLAAFSATPSVTMNTALGDLVVVGVQNKTGSIPATGVVTDTIGNTYTRLTASFIKDGGANQDGVIFFYCLSSIGANVLNIVQVSGQTSYVALAVWDIPVSGGTVALDTSTGLPATGNDAGTASENLLTGSFNTAGTDELVFAISCCSTVSITYTQESGWTLDSSGILPYQKAGAQHVHFSSAQAGITASMTLSASEFWALAAAAFTGTAAGGGDGMNGSGLLRLLGVD